MAGWLVAMSHRECGGQGIRELGGRLGLGSGFPAAKPVTQHGNVDLVRMP